MNELVQQLVSQLGVQEGQAKGGAGLLLKLAQEKLGAADFGKVAEKLPGAADLVKSAPEAGGAAKLLGGLASSLGAGKLGDLAAAASGFAKLGLDKEMIARFIPVLLSFAQSKGGPAIMQLLQGALKK
jgi:hypothetical protein